MKIILFGSTEYSVEILKELLVQNTRPVLVVTQPDRPKGRGLRVIATEVKQFCLERGLEVVTPDDLRDEDFLALVKSKQPDLYIVVAYGKILPKGLLEVPKLLPLCIHPSLLPQYRGAAPMNWTLINGDVQTGVTLFKMDARMDHGMIVHQETLPVSSEDDLISLSGKIYGLSRVLTANVLDRARNGDISLFPQAHKGLSFAPKINKEMARIDWKKDADSIRNQVRGLVPAPCAWSLFREKRVRFWKIEASLEEATFDCSDGGIIFCSLGELVIKAGKGSARVLKLQPEGKKIISAGEFINGYKPKINELFY